MMEILGQILMLAPPILITAVGACFTEITGVTNLGLEGMMLCGAFAGATVSYYTGTPYMGLAAGILAGGIISMVHAFISINLRGNQIVSGVAINLLAVALTSYLIKVLFKVAGSTPAAPRQASLMFVLILIYGLAIISNYIMYGTVLGLRMRAVGEHPLAADTVGINVYLIRYTGVIMSGLYAGLGGAYMTTVMLPSFSNNMSAGRGFMAMAAMIFGKWKPWGAMLASFLFAFGSVLEVQLKIHYPNFPQQFLAMIPYVLTLLALVGFVGKAKAPASSGQPYEKQ